MDAQGHSKILVQKQEKELAAVIPAAEPYHVVGIGASAGGLEALEQFFEHMPEDSRPVLCDRAASVARLQEHDGRTALPPDSNSDCPRRRRHRDSPERDLSDAAAEGDDPVRRDVFS